MLCNYELFYKKEGDFKENISKGVQMRYLRAVKSDTRKNRIKNEETRELVWIAE